MRGRKLFPLFGALLLLLLLATPAWADLDTELGAAIGLYEAKKSEQAVKALRLVASSPGASTALRARALLYIGLCLSKLAEHVGATVAFADAFELDPTIPIPFGTRPEIASRAEGVRLETKAKLEARADIAEWSSPSGLPQAQPQPFPPPPLPQAEPVAPLLPPPVPPAVEPGLFAPPLPAPVEAAPPPAPALPPVVLKAAPEDRDDGLHAGAGLRIVYNPIEEVVGPLVELNFGSQNGGRRLAALLTLVPGRLAGVGGALRILFGPVIQRWRIEFGFDLGVTVFPSRGQVAFDVSTQVLGFSFPAGPVRVSAKLLTVGIYANFLANPISFVPAIGAGVGVEY